MKEKESYRRPTQEAGNCQKRGAYLVLQQQTVVTGTYWAVDIDQLPQLPQWDVCVFFFPLRNQYQYGRGCTSHTNATGPAPRHQN